MDIGITEIVDEIVTSTTTYLVTFSPLFLFIGGLLLAFFVMVLIVQAIFGIKMLQDDNDKENNVL